MSSEPADAWRARRIGGRLRAWLDRRWTRRGLALLAAATLVLLVSGYLAEPWRWLAIVDGSLLSWLGLAAMARSPERPWPRAMGGAALAYLAATLALLVAGTPAPLALTWPYLAVQAALACPLGAACPLGR